jgi:hypothetical protein
MTTETIQQIPRTLGVLTGAESFEGQDGTGSFQALLSTLLAIAATPTTPGTVIIDNTSIKINGGKISAGPAHPGYKAGRFYTAFTLSQNGTFASFAANTLFAIPFYVPFPTTFAGIAASCNTVSGNLEFGIYNTAGGVPTSLVKDFGSHAMSASVINIASPTALPAGTYALAVATDTAASQFPGGSIVGGGVNSVLGSSVTGAGLIAAGWTGAWTFVANSLPANFPSPVTAESTTMPCVFMQA